MPFVQGNCTNCGGTLAVDNEKDAWICPYCNTPFIVEKAISNFNITNNITAQTVNIYGGPEKEYEIAGGTLKLYKGEATDVIVPDNVTTIAYSAFHETNITSIQLPEGIREVYLSSCKYLKEIKLPKSVVNFGLMNCSSVQNVELHEGLQFVYFEGCTSISNLKLPSTIRTIKKGTFHNCSSLSSLILPESIIKIDDDFSGCNNLTELLLPPNIETITLSSMLNLRRFVVPEKTYYVELHKLPALEKIAIKSISTIVKGLTGRERLIYNAHGFDSSMLFNDWLSLPDNVGIIRLCLALSKKCSYCGGIFDWLGKCKSCKKSKAYTIANLRCPKCNGNTTTTIIDNTKTIYRKCINCGFVCLPKFTKSSLIFTKE